MDNKLLQLAFKKPSSPYTADSWEDDAFLDPKPERAEKVSAERFETLRALKIKPDQLRNPKTRREYQEFLKQK
jgi:hypothetical protein